MPRTLRRAISRPGAKGGALIAASALVVTLVPAFALTGAEAAPTSAPVVVVNDSTFTRTSERLKASLDGNGRRVNPSSYKSYELNVALLQEALAEATPSRAVSLEVPAPNGKLVSFRVVEAPIMEDKLVAEHPEIRTFAGKSVGGTGATIRLDLTPMGFHAAVRRPGGASWYVDPAYNGDDRLHVSYLGSSLPEPEKGFVEPEWLAETDGELPDGVQEDAEEERLGEAPGGPAVKRIYRLAFATDQTYARYFGTENVLAEKVTLMNRVNQIYNDDLGITMVLINDTEKLNFDTDAEAIEPNGPCGASACYTPQQLAGCTGALLTRNQTVIGQVIGAPNYDIGHIGLGVNGGGVAQLGVVGGQNKARGCTGLPQPEGDFYAVDYVAHEMGHQFAGNHTFNGTLVNCASNKAAPAVEPGSGSSVMAYAGICGQDDLQPHTDPYFSQRSQTEISAYVLATRVVNEVQTISLFNFDGSDAFRLTFKGETTPEIRNGVNYNPEGIDLALESLPSIGPNGVTVQAWGGTGAFSTVGFQVTFNGNTAGIPPSTVQTAGLDQPFILLNPSAGDVTGDTRERDQGGPAENAGFIISTPGNRAPVTTAPPSKTIPLRTPFALTGSATDADRDSLVYIWEQNDAGTGSGTSLISQTKTNGPLFRIFGKYADVSPAGTLLINSPGENLADGNPTRVFPDMEQILANNTNADTGRCPDAPASGSVPVPIRECFSEWLPTADYEGSSAAGNNEPSLNFRLTARDLDPEAGGYSFADTKLLIDRGMGPFRVSSKNTEAGAIGGRTEVVSWAVANTNGYTDSNGNVRPSIAPTVRITLSTDGGKTFPRVLAASTPNDGSHPVTWPNVSTKEARIKIEAVDNYFFDVNNANFEIIARNTTGPVTPVAPGVNTTVRVNAPNRDVAVNNVARIRVRVQPTTGEVQPVGRVKIVMRHNKTGEAYYRETKAYKGGKIVFISSKINTRGRYTVTAKFIPRDDAKFNTSRDTDSFRVVRAN